MGVQRRGDDCIPIPNTSGLCVFLQLCQNLHTLCIDIRSEARPLHKFSTNLQSSVLIIVGTSVDRHSPTCVTHSNVDQPFETL